MTRVKERATQSVTSRFRAFWNKVVDSWTGPEAGREREERLAENARSAAEKRRKRGIPDDIEGYREKFKNGPVGRWSSPGGYGPGPSDVWEFYPGGTGKIFMYSGMGDSIQIFEWQAVADWTIQIEVTEWLEIPVNGDPPVVVDDEDGAGWGFDEIRYDFKIKEYYGPTVVMCSVPDDKDWKFHWTLHYLQFDGDIRDEELAS